MAKTGTGVGAAAGGALGLAATALGAAVVGVAAGVSRAGGAAGAVSAGVAGMYGGLARSAVCVIVFPVGAEKKYVSADTPTARTIAMPVTSFRFRLKPA